MGIRWRDLEWHTKDGVRYLRVWVDGKTGGRWLIAKHAAVDVLRRLADQTGWVYRKDSTPYRLYRYIGRWNSLA